MILVKHGGVGLQAVHEQIPKLIVGDLFRSAIMPEKDPSRIGINNKSRLVSSVKQYAVSGFRTDPVNR